MIPILSSDSYRGFSTNLTLGSEVGAQPIFIGRLIWPNATHAEDAVFKLYKTDTCGIANETIGYFLNHINGIAQPKLAAIVLLSKESLKGIAVDLHEYIDRSSDMVACWVTSFEQGVKPFRFIRRLSTFSDRQIKAFFKSDFCKRLSSVDHISGNNDRHDGNFLYKDDLHYLAIDQGCVGGSLYWHKTWPDCSAKNELLELARAELTTADWGTWASAALAAHSTADEHWRRRHQELVQKLNDILDKESRDSILEYMNERASGTTFAASCGRLI